MLVKPSEIKHQKQPCKNSCFAACIAMALGRPVKEVLVEMRTHGLHPPLFEREAWGYLVKYDVLPVNTTVLMKSFIEPDRINICTIIGSNGSLHACIIVIDSSDHVAYFYDPCKSDVIKYRADEIDVEFISIESLYDCSSFKAI